MSFKGLLNIGCRVFGHGACDCRSMRLLKNAPFCTVTKSVVRAPRTVNAVRKLSALPTHSDKREEDDSAALSMKDKLKKLWKNYGIIAITTYFGIYGATLTTAFLCLDFDLFNASSVGLDPAYAIQKVNDM
jgi:hypothetical protein